jgi:hypothetical protein
MRQIILDFGSGNTCLNDEATIRDMYDQLFLIDNKRYEIGTTVFIINCFINCERNNYINNILDNLVEELDKHEKR